MTTKQNATEKVPQKNIVDEFEMEFEEDPDEELEYFIDLVLESNFGQIKKEDLVNSVKELKVKAAKAAKTGPASKPKKEFQLSGLILEKMKEYDALKDDHLKEFLSARNRRQILVKTGLLTKDGFIVNNATAQFKKNREAQMKKHGATNSKSETEQIRLKQPKIISPYYNRSWENKDKLYNKLYGKKKQPAQLAKTQNETAVQKQKIVPKIEETVAPKKSILEKRESKVVDPKPLEQIDTNRSENDQKVEETPPAEPCPPEEEFDGFEDEIDPKEEADQVHEVPESPHHASDSPDKFNLESEASVDA